MNFDQLKLNLQGEVTLRKTWCCVCGVYGGMFRKTNGDLDSLRFSYITES